MEADIVDIFFGFAFAMCFVSQQCETIVCFVHHLITHDNKKYEVISQFEDSGHNYHIMYTFVSNCISATIASYKTLHMLCFGGYYNEGIETHVRHIDNLSA